MAKLEFEVETLDPRFFKEMAERTGRPTGGTVVRDALTLYKYFVEAKQNGKKLFIGKDPESVEEIDPTNPPARAGLKVRRRR